MCWLHGLLGGCGLRFELLVLRLFLVGLGCSLRVSLLVCESVLLNYAWFCNIVIVTMNLSFDITLGAVVIG